MPQPTTTAQHVDTLLTNVSIGYKNANYIADQLFPIVPVNKQSDLIAQLKQSFWFRDEAGLRAPGTYSVEGGYEVDNTASYFAQEFTYAHSIPDELRANYDNPYDPDRETAMFVSDKIQLKRERKFATDFFTTGVWGTDVTGGTDFTAWSNYGGSNAPQKDVEGWKDTVEGSLAVEPNVYAIGKEVLVQLKWHPDVVDSIKYVERAIPSEGLLAALFGVQKLLVGRAIHTTTKEGTAEASVSYSRVWGKHGLLLFVPGAPSLMTPAAGYNFVWQKMGGLMTVYRHRDDRARKDILEASQFFDQKAIVTAAGHFQSGLVA